MSSRQMRRLQHLVDASTGADALAEGLSEDAQVPPTMKPAGTERRKKGQKKNASNSGASTSTAPSPTSTHSPKPAAAPAQPAPLHEHSNDATDSVMACEVPEPVAAEGARPTSASPKPATKPVSTPTAAVSSTGKAKGKGKGKKHAARVDEEDALLEAVLQQRAKEAAALGEDSGDTEPADASHDLTRLLMECDTTRLDTRIERVRAFGPNAVEDYGDNLTTSRMPDGQPRDNGSHSLFPEHRGHFYFKTSPFASPNRHRWPPFDSEETFMEVVHEGGERKDASPLVFRLHTETPAFRRAENARLAAIEGHGDVQVLINCLAEHGVYHIPTLLQLRETFQLMNDALRAHEMVDVALYYTGLLLSRFPLARTWRSRQVPLRLDEPMGSVWLHRTLWAGIHVALSRGCMRTAFETNRFLLSLDPDDTAGSLLLLDYTALRAKRWVWLLEVFTLFRAALPDGVPPEVLVASPYMCTGADNSNTETRDLPSVNAVYRPEIQAWDSQHTALWMCLSPGLAFSAALARHMLEREERLYADEVAQNPSAKKAKVLKEMTAAQTALVRDCPPAEQIFAWAAQSYPFAAAALVEELGGIDSLCKGQAPNALWHSVEDSCAALKRAATINMAWSPLNSAMRHVSELFAGRAAEMWKAPDLSAFLRLVLTDPNVCAAQEGGLFDAARADRIVPTLQTLVVDETTREVTAQRYEHISVGYLRGDAPTALPAELLNGAGDEDDEAGALDPAQWEALVPQRQYTPSQLASMDRESLVRFRALYGVTADPDDQDTEAELTAFRERFAAEGGPARYLGDMNVFMYALYTLTPGNTVESMALKKALDAHGIPDPVQTEVAANRARDAEMWEADNDAAWEDEESPNEDNA